VVGYGELLSKAAESVEKKGLEDEGDDEIEDDVSERTVTIKMKPIRMRPKMVAAVTVTVRVMTTFDAAQARMRAEMER
jgi:hypothetical protein